MSAPFQITVGSVIEDGIYETFGLISLTVDEQEIVAETRYGGSRTWRRQETAEVLYGPLRGKFRPVALGGWFALGRWFGIQHANGDIPPVAIAVFQRRQLIRALDQRGWPVSQRSWSPT